MSYSLASSASMSDRQRVLLAVELANQTQTRSPGLNCSQPAPPAVDLHLGVRLSGQTFATVSPSSSSVTVRAFGVDRLEASRTCLGSSRRNSAVPATSLIASFGSAFWRSAFGARRLRGLSTEHRRCPDTRPTRRTTCTRRRPPVPASSPSARPRRRGRRRPIASRSRGPRTGPRPTCHPRQLQARLPRLEQLRPSSAQRRRRLGAAGGRGTVRHGCSRWLIRRITAVSAALEAVGEARQPCPSSPKSAEPDTLADWPARRGRRRAPVRRPAAACRLRRDSSPSRRSRFVGSSIGLYLSNMWYATAFG